MTDTKFDIEKAAKIIINKMNKEELTKQEQKAEAWEAYEAIAEPARKAYYTIVDPAWKAYEVIADPAWEAYEAKCREIDKQETIKIIDGKRYRLIEKII